MVIGCHGSNKLLNVQRKFTYFCILIFQDLKVVLNIAGLRVLSINFQGYTIGYKAKFLEGKWKIDVKRWKVTVTFPFFPPIPIMTIYSPVFF